MSTDSTGSGSSASSASSASPTDSAERQILRGTKATLKSYAFDEEHDPTVPAQWWFQKSYEGDVLFIVFYSQACRWSQCLGCNLPSTCSQHHIGYRELMAQIDHVFRHPKVIDAGERVKKLIVSNNGSMMDEKTFASSALVYLFAKINLHMPQVAAVTIESRPEYVDLAELEMLSRVLKEAEIPAELEIGIGFEAFDDRIRNEVFRKGLSLAAFERLVRDVAPYGFRLKCYLMQKPVPGMTDEEGVEDVVKAIDYLGGIARDSGVKINVHLNPTYVAAGTMLAEAFEKGEYSPPTLIDVARAVRTARGKSVSVFVGLYDEGLAVEGGSFLRPGDEEVVAKLEAFNLRQEFDVLDELPA